MAISQFEIRVPETGAVADTVIVEREPQGSCASLTKPIERFPFLTAGRPDGLGVQGLRVREKQMPMIQFWVQAESQTTVTERSDRRRDRSSDADIIIRRRAREGIPESASASVLSAVYPHIVPGSWVVIEWPNQKTTGDRFTPRPSLSSEGSELAQLPKNRAPTTASAVVAHVLRNLQTDMDKPSRSHSLTLQSTIRHWRLSHAQSETTRCWSSQPTRHG